MQRYQYPHTIENGAGERLTFVRLQQQADGDLLEVENFVEPGSGPPLHTHFQQEESLTVVQGRVGVQIPGQADAFYEEGATVTFHKGQPHRFWNAGSGPLICKGWVKPAHNIEYFLTEIYRSTRENGGKQPDQFDAAYLLTKYKTEFSMDGIPGFVRSVIFPITVFFGKLAGKHKKFSDGPAPLP